MLLQRVLDLAEFDPEPADFDLFVNTFAEFEITVGVIAD